jgi:hypothetical protein
VIYTVAGSVLSILLGLMAALLVHGEFPGRALLRGLFISPYIAPCGGRRLYVEFYPGPATGRGKLGGCKQGPPDTAHSVSLTAMVGPGPAGGEGACAHGT